MSNSHPLSSAEVKHGFSASSFAVVRLEGLKDVADLKADLVACYKPVNSQELLALERMALCQHQIFRGARLEAGLFTSALDEVLDQAGDPIRPCQSTSPAMAISKSPARKTATSPPVKASAASQRNPICGLF